MSERRKKENIRKWETIGEHRVPFYLYTTSDGVTALVPKYIRRIAGKRMAGWQIAFVRQATGSFTRYFPDKNENPVLNLERAVRELRRFLASTPNQKLSGLSVVETKKSLYKTGIAGVRFAWALHNRAGTYELRVVSRSGVYNVDKAISRHVGNEFGVTQENYLIALNEGLRFREIKIAEAAANGQTFTRLDRDRPTPCPNLDNVFQALLAAKERNSELHIQIAERKAQQFFSAKNNTLYFRGKRIFWKNVRFDNRELRVPAFVHMEGGLWVFEFILPDGSIYGDSLPVSTNPEADIKSILKDCYYESIMTTVKPEKAKP